MGHRLPNAAATKPLETSKVAKKKNLDNQAPGQVKKFAVAVLLSLTLCFLAISWSYSAPEAQPLAERVLIVANKASSDGLEVARYYQKRRQIPAQQLLIIQAPLKEEIDRQSFQEQIKAPIEKYLEERALWDKILFIVLTPGIPLKIKGSGGKNGQRASVDSELCLLYRDMLYGRHRLSGWLPNPYFGGQDKGPFGHRNQEIYLVTRLAGYSKKAALALIDRALRAQAWQRPKFLLNAKTPGNRPGDNWLWATAKALERRRARVIFEWRRFITEAYHLMGYSSWGSNDPRYPRDRGLKLGFLPGALATTFVSTNARTFSPPPPGWKIGRFRQRKTYFAGSPQSLIGDLIEAGVTGVAGNVYEPYLSACARPHLLFPAYLDGRTLAESFYGSLRYLSWQEVVIGDPLTSPYGTPPPRDERERYLRGDYFKARRALYKKMLSQKDSARRRLYLAEIALRQGWRKRAIRHLQKALEFEPRGPYRLMLARLYLEEGNKRAAQKVISGPIPETPPLLRSKANLLLALGDKESAYLLARRVVAETPDSGLSWLLLGRAARAKGLYSEATRALEKASARLGFSPLALTELALALKEEGQKKRARRILEKLLAYPQAVELYPLIFRELEELKKTAGPRR